MISLKKRLLSWQDIEGNVLEIARQMNIDEWRPDIIVGITRGGAMPAVMLSHYLECKMVGLDVALRDSDTGPEANLWLPEDALNGKRILIVDDINDTGATINWIMNDWESFDNREFPWGQNVRFAVVINNEASNANIEPHYIGESINKQEDNVWLVFPYEDFWKGR